MCGINTETSIPLYPEDIEGVFNDTRYACFNCSRESILEIAGEIKELRETSGSLIIIFFDGIISLEEAGDTLSLSEPSVKDKNIRLYVAYNSCSDSFTEKTLISVWYL